jgi:hypothetical protein
LGIEVGRRFGFAGDATGGASLGGMFGRQARAALIQTAEPLCPNVPETENALTTAFVRHPRLSSVDRCSRVDPLDDLDLDFKRLKYVLLGV